MSLTKMSVRAISTRDLTATAYAVLPVATVAGSQRANQVSAKFATTEAGSCTFPGATPAECSATLSKEAILPRLSRRIGVQLRDVGLRSALWLLSKLGNVAGTP